MLENEGTFRWEDPKDDDPAPFWDDSSDFTNTDIVDTDVLSGKSSISSPIYQSSCVLDPLTSVSFTESFFVTEQSLQKTMHQIIVSLQPWLVLRLV
jgi:hypothetical protein